MIGTKIKYYRKQVNLTLQEISHRTGLSVGYLSNLERNQTSPTFDNLCAICDAMSVSVVDLITRSLAYQPCMKKATRKALYSPDYRFHYEYTTDENLPMVGICMTLPEDYFGTEVSWGHDTDEYGVLAKGSMIFEVSGETYLLEEGDAIYVKAGTPHKWRKSGQGECISYWTRINFISESHPHYLNHFEVGLFNEPEDKGDK